MSYNVQHRLSGLYVQMCHESCIHWFSSTHIHTQTFIKQAWTDYPSKRHRHSVFGAEI